MSKGLDFDDIAEYIVCELEKSKQGIKALECIMQHVRTCDLDFFKLLGAHIAMSATLHEMDKTEGVAE